MKKVLTIIGILAILAIVIAIGGGYFAYKKGSTAFIQVGRQGIESFLSTKKPPEVAAHSLRRLLDASRLTKSWTATWLMSLALLAMKDDVVTNEEAKMLEDASLLAEQNNMSKEKMAEFMKKYEQILPPGIAKYSP